MKQFEAILTHGMRSWFTRKITGNTGVEAPILGAGKGIYQALNDSYLEKRHLIGYDDDSNLRIADALHVPVAFPITCNIQANGSIATSQTFFTMPNIGYSLEVVAIEEVHSVAAGATSTGFVSKEAAGEGKGTGVSLMSGTFNLNATANTPQSATLAGIPAARARYDSDANDALMIAPGEALSMNVSTVGSLAGLAVTVWVRPCMAQPMASLFINAVAGMTSKSFYLNQIQGLTIAAISVRLGTPDTDTGTVTVDVTRDAADAAAGAGTSVLAAAQSIIADDIDADTTVNLTLGAASVLTMNAGERLSVEFAGITDAAEFCLTVAFTNGITGVIQVSQSLWDAPLTDRTLLLANRGYRLLSFAEAHDVPSSGGTVQPTREAGTTAPGSGTAMGATIDTSASDDNMRNSVIDVAWPNQYVAAGNRISANHGGTTTNLADTVVSMILQPQ